MELMPVDKSTRYSRVKFVIGGEGFATKKAVRDRVREILYRTMVGATVAEEDNNFLKAFFVLHPNLQKRTKEALWFSVECNPGVGVGFVMHRADGTSTDISYQKPLRALTNLDSHKADVLLAMREAIDGQIAVFRFSQEAGWDEELVVDHQYPATFDRLSCGFLQDIGLRFCDVRLTSEDNQVGRRMHVDLEQDWQEYHKTNAVLRLVDRTSNSRWGNRDPEMFGGEAS